MANQFQTLEIDGRSVARVTTTLGLMFVMYLSPDEAKQQFARGYLMTPNAISNIPELLPWRHVARIEWGFSPVEIAQMKDAINNGRLATPQILTPGQMPPGSFRQ